MKYYKLNGEVYAFDIDGSGDSFIKDGMVRMTENEVLAHTSQSEVLKYDAETDTINIDQELVAIKKLKDQGLAWANIKEARQSKMLSGVYVESVDKHFHTDESSFSQYAHIASLLSLGLFESKNWKSIEGDFVELAEVVFRELQQAISAHSEKVYAKAEYHKYMMLQVDQPLDYDFNVGW